MGGNWQPCFNKVVGCNRAHQISELFYIFFQGKHTDGQKAFTSVGGLIAFLLAADYALAGKATMPTSSEMGAIVKEIKAGGLKGLRLLGYPCLTEEETGSAFEQVSLHLDRAIPEHRRGQIPFNPFFVEHTLCKIDRLDISEYRIIDQA